MYLSSHRYGIDITDIDTGIVVMFHSFIYPGHNQAIGA
jgi:hypothetical protein